MIQSMFDDDLYKFTMQQAVLKLYPDAVATYRFKNRGSQKFDRDFLKRLNSRIEQLADMKVTDDELQWFSNLSFVFPWYVEFLRTYRYKPKEVNAYFDADKNFQLEITGPWYSTILWEVKLLALISEVYFEEQNNWSMDGQNETLHLKINKLGSYNCRYADFGTRRRRCFDIQERVVKLFKNHHHFVGTSNVHLAHKYNVRPIGTMAHEWVQGVATLESLNHANRVMLQRWTDVYDSNLGIALTDTYGTDAFFRDFSMRFSKLFDGVRHDSGDPLIFAKRVVEHYKSVGVNPKHKSIVFSDSLNADKATKIQEFCNDIGINCSFGIGTNFTNDFQTPALNIVIKLWSMNGNPSVKLSDVVTKANGDPKAIEMMRWMYGV